MCVPTFCPRLTLFILFKHNPHINLLFNVIYDIKNHSIIPEKVICNGPRGVSTLLLWFGFRIFRYSLKCLAVFWYNTVSHSTVFASPNMRVMQVIPVYALCLSVIILPWDVTHCSEIRRLRSMNCPRKVH